MKRYTAFPGVAFRAGIAALGIVVATIATAQADTAKICLRNNGGYLVELQVRYDNREGDRELQRTGKFPIGKKRCVIAPTYASDIHITVEPVGGSHHSCDYWFDELVADFQYSIKSSGGALSPDCTHNWRE